MIHMTHHYAARIPDELWQQLNNISDSTGVSVNTLLVNFASSGVASGTVSWTNTAYSAASSTAGNYTANSFKLAEPQEGQP